MATEWAQVQAIELVNDGTGLGFGIIGAKTSGVIVKTILAGGVADRDGRLLSGDHILQIGEVNLHEMVSEQVASVLRKSGTHVRLIVARSVDPLNTNQDVDGGAAIIPSRLIADPHELLRYLVAAGYPDIFGNSLELPETEKFTVELTKDSNGLGITIAGYVCEKEELSGIFVKSVTPGSAADCGKIQVNDRIIEVDGQSLHGFSNHQAVDVLKQSGNVVSLCLERYLRGLKFEQLQQAIAANETKSPIAAVIPPMPITKSMSATASPASSSRRQSFNDERKLLTARDSIETKLKHEIDYQEPESSVDNEDDLINELSNHHIHSTPKTLHKYHIEPKLTKEHEDAIIKKWRGILGNDDDSKIIVAQIRKFAASSGLGISLEGTVDVEGGREVRPHHYIRSILPEGPVGSNGLLRSGDELLEVNNQRLLGMNHMQVVSILKELPQDVRMVCRRGITEIIAFTEENVRNSILDSNDSNNNSNPLMSTDRLVKAKSDGSLSTAVGNGDGFTKIKSRSLEPLTGLAMWSSQPQVIELVKGERGLGFSILDYQDPLDPNDTLIVIRSLVPGGVAQMDGRLIPGDRLLFVNETRLENASLDQAVQALKGECLTI